MPDGKAYLLAYCIIALIIWEYAAGSRLTVRQLKLSSILDSSPWQEFPVRGGSPCQRRSRLQESNGASGTAPRASRDAVFVGLIGRHVGRCGSLAATIARRFGRSAARKKAENSQRGSEIIPSFVSFCLSRPLIFSERGPTLRSSRTPATRDCPAASADGSCWSPIERQKEKRKIGII